MLENSEKESKYWNPFSTKIPLALFLLLLNLCPQNGFSLQYVNFNRLPWLSEIKLDSQTQHLFTLTRSVNQNRVHYALFLDQEKIKVSTPLVVYWEMTEKGGRLEDLSELEKRKAYGPVFEKKDGEKVVFALAALPKQKIAVEKKMCAGVEKWHAILSRGELMLSIDRVSVQLEGDSFFPKVQYVEINGKKCSDGELQRVRLDPTESW